MSWKYDWHVEVLNIIEEIDSLPSDEMPVTASTADAVQRLLNILTREHKRIREAREWYRRMLFWRLRRTS